MDDTKSNLEAVECEYMETILLEMDDALGDDIRLLVSLS